MVFGFRVSRFKPSTLHPQDSRILNPKPSLIRGDQATIGPVIVDGG